MRPAADLVTDGEILLAVHHAWIGWPEQEIIDALGVGLDVTREAAKHLADDGAGLLGRVLEEDVVGIGV